MGQYIYSPAGIIGLFVGELVALGTWIALGVAPSCVNSGDAEAAEMRVTEYHYDEVPARACGYKVDDLLDPGLLVSVLGALAGAALETSRS